MKIIRKSFYIYINCKDIIKIGKNKKINVIYMSVTVTYCRFVAGVINRFFYFPPSSIKLR